VLEGGTCGFIGGWIGSRLRRTLAAAA